MERKHTGIKLFIANAFIIFIAVYCYGRYSGIYAIEEEPVLAAVLITALVMLIPVFFVINYRILRTPKQVREQAPEFEINGEHSEDYYRKQLRKYKALLPAFAAQIEAAEAQLNSIAKKRSILLEVLNRNKSDCPDLVATCDETTVIICQNIRAMLNRLNIASGIDPKNPHSKELLTKHASTIDGVLKKNYGILASFDDFLTYAAGMKDKIHEEDIGLKATITSLKQLY